jgi:hypothetical protein
LSQALHHHYLNQHFLNTFADVLADSVRVHCGCAPTKRLLLWVNLFVANEEFQLVARVADRSNFGVAKEREPRVAEQADWFATTHWSVVRTAGDPAPTVVQEALAVQTKNATNYDR